MADEAKHPVETSRKTIRIIEALYEVERAGVTELAATTGLNKSTVHNHLSTLKEEELVVQEDGEYSLSLHFLKYGGSVLDRYPLYEVAAGEIERLATKSGEIANLVVEEYGRGTYLMIEKGEDAVDLDLHMGLRRPLHVTASGKAILAHLPSERVNEIIERHGLPKQTEQSITNPELLRENLQEIRERGFAIDRQEHIQGLRCIGVPILNEQEEVLGSVSVSTPTTRMDDDRFFDQLPDMVRSATNVIELHIQNQ